jgi:hypothetical protein
VRRVRQEYMSQGKKALKDSAKDDLKKYEDDVQVRCASIFLSFFFFFFIVFTAVVLLFLVACCL